MRLQRCCGRVEDQFGRAGTRLRVSDVEHVYASSFLSLVSRWEAFLEDTLLETVCGPANGALSRRRLVRISTPERFRSILLHPNLDYVSMPTLKRAKDLFELYLVDGGPVAGITEANRTYIQQASWIRNAIAHASNHAERTFKEKVPGVDSLANNRRQPGPFLRHQFRQSPDQRRFELYLGAFLSAAREMDAAWSA